MATGYVNIPPQGSPSWKDPVANVGALPVSGNSVGDARVAEATNAIYIWSGSAWVGATASGVAWGSITGTLSNQTDLQTALNAKAASGANSDITSLSGVTGSIASPTFIDFPQQGSAPATPSAGHDRLYFRTSDGTPVYKDSAGTVHTIGGGTPGGSTTQLQYNNSGAFSGISTLVYSGGNPYSTGNFGFNQTSPAFPADVKSNIVSVSPPATVTITADIINPSTVGYCTGAFSGDERQYDNNQTACIANGECSDPQYTDQTTCEFNGDTWTVNTFNPVTPGVPYFPIPANTDTINYTLNSYNATYNFYSATGTTQSYTPSFDTDPMSITPIQNTAGTGYIADGTTYTWTVYCIYGDGSRSQGSVASNTDNNDGNPYSWDLSWANPFLIPTSYYIYNHNTGNAATSFTNSIVDDNGGAWTPVNLPTLAQVSYTVSWSAVAGASSYHITGPLGSYAFYPTTSFIDTGIPYYNNSSANPKGPYPLTGLQVDGITVLKNTQAAYGQQGTLQVWSSAPGTYSQQWFDNSGNLKAYMDGQGTFTGNFNSISGNLSLGGTLTASSVLTNSLQALGASATFEWATVGGINNFFRAFSLNGGSGYGHDILYFDSQPTGTLSSDFGGGITFRTSYNPPPTFTPSASIYSSMINNVSSATYNGALRMGTYSASNSNNFKEFVRMQMETTNTDNEPQTAWNASVTQHVGNIFGNGPDYTIVRLKPTSTPNNDLFQITDASSVIQAHVDPSFSNWAANQYAANVSSLGSEKLTNGTFTGSASSWTLNTGWTYASNNVLKSADGTGTLLQTSASMATALVVGQMYQLQYTMSSWTVGTVTPACGGVTMITDNGIFTNGNTQTRYFRAISTADLTFTPSNTARFHLDNISLKQITAGDVVAAGNIIGSTLSGGLVGTTTNNNASSGNVGEYVSASVAVGSAVTLTSATPATVTSVSLTAGDWDVSGVVCMNGTITGTQFIMAIGQTTNSLTGTTAGDDQISTPTMATATSDVCITVPAVRKSLASTTTIYLIAQDTFTVGTAKAYGRISARRVR